MHAITKTKIPKIFARILPGRQQQQHCQARTSAQEKKGNDLLFVIISNGTKKKHESSDRCVKSVLRGGCLETERAERRTTGY